jgi:phosphoribosylformylglycinamidine synthase subunit PurQ / glutaminase
VNVGIVVFPGSNCDADTYHAVRAVCGYDAQYVWHEEPVLAGVDVVILPGGFSYGDYLRAGAIAATSPVVRALGAYVAQGGLVLGICNGFQTLLEAGLLPGAMQPNLGGEFRCEPVRVRTDRADTPFTCALRPGDVLRLPIAHAEGRYYADPGMRARLSADRQVAFRYCDASGAVTAEANPNGSLDGIAGLLSASGRVLGLMPHPERACEDLLGSADGRLIFESLARWIGSARLRPAPVETAP